MERLQTGEASKILVYPNGIDDDTWRRTALTVVKGSPRLQVYADQRQESEHGRCTCIRDLPHPFPALTDELPCKIMWTG